MSTPWHANLDWYNDLDAETKEELREYGSGESPVGNTGNGSTVSVAAVVAPPTCLTKDAPQATKRSKALSKQKAFNIYTRMINSYARDPDEINRFLLDNLAVLETINSDELRRRLTQFKKDRGLAQDTDGQVFPSAPVAIASTSTPAPAATQYVDRETLMEQATQKWFGITDVSGGSEQ